jgi:glycosyltransferase involved in cell wall biosynthesis
MLLLSRSLPIAEYVNFGFWWGMSIMIGGIALGGVSAALARQVALDQALPALLANNLFLARTPVVLLGVVLVLLASAKVLSTWQHSQWVLVSLAPVLGALIQASATLAAIIRVLSMRRHLVILGLAQAILVPIGLVFGLKAAISPPTALSALIGISVGNAMALAASLVFLRYLPLDRTSVESVEQRSDSASRNLLAFTVVNFFVYALLNGDFLIIRSLATTTTLEQIGPIKIFFERFVLPLWLVLATASSLQVFRASSSSLGNPGILTRIRAISRLAGAALVGALVSAACYLGYLSLTLPGKSDGVWLVVVAAVGYAVYGVTTTLLDIFVLANPLARAIPVLALLLACCGVGQIWLVVHFEKWGWAVGWAFWNSLLALVLIIIGGSVERRTLAVPSGKESSRKRLIASGDRQRVLWFVASLDQRGGGDRFALETVQALQNLGISATIICDRMSEVASFGGKYDLSDVACLNNGGATGAYWWRALRKAFGVVFLYRTARKLKPDLMICQSEYDAIKLAVVSKLLGCRYRVFIFGQMFQLKDDLSKYSLTFRRHLADIAASRPGYAESVQFPPPRFGLRTLVVNELASWIKFHAVRAADRIFVLSAQVQWEVDKLYGRKSTIARAAFPLAFVDRSRLASASVLREPIRLLSVCRLLDKKRVAVIIRALAVCDINANLRVIGSGPERSALDELARRLGVDSRVNFLGSVGDDVVLDELQSADCFISMDIGDFDISVMEAMAKGLRVIVARDFDVSSLPTGLTGIVAVDANAEALGSAIRALPTMAAPTVENIPLLATFTWETLAGTCIS